MDVRESLEGAPGVGSAPRRRARSALRLGLVALACVAAAATALAAPDWLRATVDEAVGRAKSLLGERSAAEEADAPAKAEKNKAFRLTDRQRQAIETYTITDADFRPKVFAEGRISLNEDFNVPVYSPYAGRIVSIDAKAGDDVRRGQTIFTVEATDMVAAQNDFQSATNALAKSREQLRLNKTVADRLQELFQAKAVALKDYQSAQNDLIGTQSDVRTAEAALQAVTNRLRILGKSDDEIAAFGRSGKMGPETEIRSPIDGTVVQRRAGLGQYVTTSSDPAFTVGNLSTVWLVANIRETEIPLVRIGQSVEATVSGFGDRVFKARVNYIAATLDPATRRLAVRSEVDNSERLLRPEMFARFRIVTGEARSAPAVPDGAVVYEGETARVWIIKADGRVESRNVELGLRDGRMIEVRAGLGPGDTVVSRGALFIDRAASGDRSS